MPTDFASLLTLLFTLGFLAAAGVTMIILLASWLDRFQRRRKRGRQVKLEGREFDIVPEGLSEDQVASFIQELKTQHNAAAPTPAEEIAVPIGTQEEKEVKIDDIGDASKAEEKTGAAIAVAGSAKVEETAPEPAASSLETSPKVWPTLTKEEIQSLYTGEVEIVLGPSVDLALISELCNYIQGSPQIKIVRVAGFWERGSAIGVSLQESLPLIAWLLDMPGIKARTQPSEKGGFPEEINVAVETDQFGKRKVRIGLKRNDGLTLER